MNELEKSLREALKQLDKIEMSPFSLNGFEQFKGKISEFIYSVYVESHRVSRLNQSDTISGEHVGEASTKLFKIRRSKRNNVLNSIGGLLLGGTISNIFAMTSYGVAFSTVGIIITIFAGLIGSFILGYYLFNE